MWLMAVLCARPYWQGSVHGQSRNIFGEKWSTIATIVKRKWIAKTHLIFIIIQVVHSIHNIVYLLQRNRWLAFLARLGTWPWTRPWSRSRARTRAWRSFTPWRWRGTRPWATVNTLNVNTAGTLLHVTQTGTQLQWTKYNCMCTLQSAQQATCKRSSAELLAVAMNSVLNVIPAGSRWTLEIHNITPFMLNISWISGLPNLPPQQDGHKSLS